MRNSQSAGDVRAQAVFGHRTAALAARAAVVVIAFYLTIPLVARDAAIPGFDATVLATLAAALVVAACGALALLARNNRKLNARLKETEERAEELTDRNWELKEAVERDRGILEALGDVIVRRDADSRIIYANDAFCRLAARALDTWAGGPGRVREVSCKFTKSVVVPDDDAGVQVRVAGTVKQVSEDAVHVALEVTCGDEKVLGQPKAVIVG